MSYHLQLIGINHPKMLIGKKHLNYTKYFVQDQEKNMIPVLLMCLCRLSILWKKGTLFPGGHLPKNRKS